MQQLDYKKLRRVISLFLVTMATLTETPFPFDVSTAYNASLTIAPNTSRDIDAANKIIENSNVTFAEIEDKILINVLIYSFVFPVVVVFGLGINLLSFIAITKHPKKNGNDFLLLGLTTADILYFIGTLIVLLNVNIEMYTTRYRKDRNIDPVWISIGCRYPVSISKIITAFISTERMTAVFLPLIFQRIWTRKFVMMGLTGIFVLFGVMYGSLLYLKPANADALYNVVTATTAMTTTVVCNLTSLFGLFQKKKDILFITDEQIQYRMIQERRWTKVLIGISLLTVLFSIIPLGNNIFQILYEGSWENEQTNPFWSLFNIGTTISHVALSCTNSIIFVLNNKSYKENFLLFTLCRYRKTCSKIITKSESTYTATCNSKKNIAETSL